MDWSRLSPLDFEDLVGDLLEADEGLSLERFGPGPDGGIDLRADPPGRRTVVQCKHYLRTGWPVPEADLRREKVKIGKIRLTRYVVATTVSLSTANKDSVAQLFHPWMTGTGDATLSELRDWVSATVNAIDDWDDLQQVVSFTARAPARFDADLVDLLVQRFYEHADSEVEWARRDAEDRDSAHAALERINEVARALGQESNVTAYEHDRVAVDRRQHGPK